MSIRKYPAGNQDRDARVAPKRDSGVRMGTFGAIVYTYLLALEATEFAGKLYHPVDTPQEATTWLAYYKAKTVATKYDPKPLYHSAYFIPNGFDE